MNEVRLKDGDIARAASTLNVEEAAVRAVIDVESSGSGFWKVEGYADIVPVINYEQQWFSRLTDRKYDSSHPEISSRALDRKFGKSEWNRFSEATKLDREAAIKATSWGLFQIMGFNHSVCGFSSAEDFVKAMTESEGRQLDAFIGFIKSNSKLHDAMKTAEWSVFAYHYNGPKYAMNAYDTRLEKAYKEHGGKL